MSEALELDEVISFEGFVFSKWYEGEPQILQPRLEALGYTNVKWFMGERDSFGPLTRYCEATTPDGDRVKLWYG